MNKADKMGDSMLNKADKMGDSMVNKADKMGDSMVNKVDDVNWKMDEVKLPGVVEQPATPETGENTDEKQPNGEEESKYLKFYPFMTSEYYVPKLPKSFSNPLPQTPPNEIMNDE